MTRFRLSLSSYEGLPADENRIFRNFNILLLIGLLDILVIAFALWKIEPRWPFFLCLIQFFLFTILLVVHTHGYFLTVRFITFILTTLLQVIACITHGKAAGFDYLFFAISVLPMMFFNERKYYISLFIFSLSAFLIIRYSYDFIDPIVILKNNFMQYWNISITAIIIMLVMFAFKTGYQKSERILQEQNKKILLQKEEIEVINNNLAHLVEERSSKVLEHENRFVHFAHINAHRVRGPLARILGLLNLIDLEEDTQKALNHTLPLIKSNAQELNHVLKEVDTILNTTKLDKVE